MARLKAASIINTIDLARGLVGEPRFGEMISTLPPATQALFGRRILPIEWIEADHWLPFQQAMLYEHFEGDEMPFRDFIRKVCERDFNTFYKVILKILVSPDFLLERAAKLWRTYHDSGELRVMSKEKRSGRMHIHLRVEKLETRFPVFGPLMQGFIEQLFHMTGARDIHVERQVRISGGLLDGDFHASYVL